jgi:hypothetical protein
VRESRSKYGRQSEIEITRKGRVKQVMGCPEMAL